MKEKLKVYHGLPKTPTTENTLFYASFDGSVHPEIHYGHMTKQGVERSFSAGVTGYCLKELNGSSELTYEFPEYATNNLPEVSTVDLWAYYPGYQGKIMRFAYAMFSDIIILHDEYLFVGFWRNRIRIKKLEKGYYHFRLIIKPLNRTTGETSIDLYINGKKEGTYITTISDDENPLATVSFGHMNNDSYACAVSDVHVTLEDLGDYFPTLPQDFIDGKAIVVPTLNQRQSYGDPVLHQVTELVVKNQPAEILGTIYDLNDRDADGLERCFTNPELRTAHAYSWIASLGKIRITGLDTTFITGVVDTDTAKCRVMSSTERSGTLTVSVDTTSGLVVGDRLWIYDSTMTNLWNTDPNFYIEVIAIDSVNKTITIQSNYPSGISVTTGDLLIETTTSSSSPIVKTVDGVTVNGTWSGLGTQQATFTFGDNSSIEGKDLVVTYCLNARGNSSPYPKMPSEVIRGYDELGNELVPVSIPVFKDDFRGKVKGNLDVCPHYASYLANPTLIMPTSFNPDAYINYASLYSQDDVLLTLGNKLQPTNVSQACFSFDVLSLLKHKLGKDDLTIQQAINLIESINFNVYGYGYGNNVHALNTTVYVVDTNEWSGNVETHNESKVTHLLKSTGDIARVIDSKGFTHFLVYTNACGSHDSTLMIDYVNIELVLKTEERFTYLALDEEDIDRSKKCNPILVDMQTKEVKRLLPSKAPFSTEVLLYDLPSMNLAKATEVLRGDFAFCTTNGSGKSCEVADTYRGCIGKMGQPSYAELNDVIHSTHIGSNQRTKLIPRQFYHTSTSKNEYSYDGDLENIPFMSVGCDLFESNKELYLRTFFQHINGTKRTKYEQIFTPLPNRPLIK